MIIFNLYAIVVAIFILIGALPIFALRYFDLIGDQLALVLVAWETLLVSAVSHRAGIKGRLFFLPMWILAIPTAFIITYAIYGWAGIASVVGPVLGFVGLMLFLGYRSERKRADNIVFESGDLPYDEANPLEFWKALKEKLFFPTFLGLNEQICDFNARVLKYVERYPLSMASLPAFRAEMESHAQVFDKKRLNQDLLKAFNDEIDTRIQTLEKMQPAKA